MFIEIEYLITDIYANSVNKFKAYLNIVYVIMIENDEITLSTGDKYRLTEESISKIKKMLEPKK